MIVGGGVMEEELKQKVYDLGIMDKVIFCGFDNNPFKYVSRSDCFVLSSDVEGFPNVLIEALACGKTGYFNRLQQRPKGIAGTCNRPASPGH